MSGANAALSRQSDMRRLGRDEPAFGLESFLIKAVELIRKFLAFLFEFLKDRPHEIA